MTPEKRDQDAESALRNIAGDNLCWIEDTVKAKALPEAEFLESCRRYHKQIAGERGIAEGGMTIAQLEVSLAKTNAEAAELREALELMPYAVPEERVVVMQRKDSLYTGHDPLYGVDLKWYPASVLVDSEKLVRVREALSSTTAGQSILTRLAEAGYDATAVQNVTAWKAKTEQRLRDAERALRDVQKWVDGHAPEAARFAVADIINKALNSPATSAPAERPR